MRRLRVSSPPPPLTLQLLLSCALALLLLSASALAGAAVRPATAAGPALTATVHHAIRFDRRVSSPANAVVSLGSQASLLRGSVAPFNPANLAAHRRQTVFIPAERHLTAGEWEALVNLPVRGVVAALSPFDTHNERVFQLHLAREAVPFPVYFLPQNGEDARRLTATFTALRPGEYAVISVGGKETAVANASVVGVNLYAALVFKPKEAKAAVELPRLLLTASFDTLGVAPTAHTTGGASGVAAALELWRRFNVEAASAAAAEGRRNGAASSSAPFGLSVLLGNTARFNYAGTARWITGREEGDLDRYRLVICLDELLRAGTDENEAWASDADGDAAATPLFMHVHESFAKTPQFAAVKETAEATAARHGIALTVVSAKMNYRHYDVRFEHEVLAHRQIPAVTFSAVRKYRVDQLFRGGHPPISVDAAVNATAGAAAAQPPKVAVALSRRVDFVHAFAGAMLARSPTTAPWVGSAAYMLGLLRHASDAERSPVSHDGAGPWKYAEALAAHMRQTAATSAPRRAVATGVSVSTYRFKPTGVVLVGPYEQVMRVFVARSLVVELGIFAAALVAVLAFAVCEFGAEKTRRALLGPFMLGRPEKSAA
ncbi:nicalin [Trypanosoma conorhini]|uniref:Nicalin n=1 Tax=Trypanosoma conorhini TaxID=83891 RepID=A0A3R7SB36_9TRYP|nr:nicalin [Trypanosoma conorhini]RNF27389.1 nicalin [Trypanosoma conorhini]